MVYQCNSHHIDFGWPLCSIWSPWILFGRLDDWFRVTGKALDWHNTYLTGRHQRIKLGDCLPSKVHVPFGVPQGSVLGPVLFTLYTTLHLMTWFLFMRFHRIPTLMIASCMCPLHHVLNCSAEHFRIMSSLYQSWMFDWPKCVYWCSLTNWNWSQTKQTTSLSRMKDREVNTSLCFPLSFMVLKLAQHNLFGILE